MKYLVPKGVVLQKLELSSAPASLPRHVYDHSLVLVGICSEPIQGAKPEEN